MPVFRFRTFVAPLVVILTVVAACADRNRGRNGAADSARAVDIRDDFGEAVPVGRRPPTRIVSLNPTTTEILFAIGAGPSIVGRTQYDLWPDSAKLVASLGPGIRPNIEAVLATRPDLVVLYAGADNRPAADRLRSAGIVVVAFKVDSIEEFRRVTRVLGALVGDTARARAVVDSVDRTLQRVAAATRTLARPRVFFHSWEKPLLTIGGGSFMSQLVAIAGGRNIYDSLSAPSPAVTLEDVVQRDPDIVLVSPIERARMLASAQWQVLRAVRDGHVFAYDTNLVARPSVKLGEAAVSLAQLLHPGVVR
jgi:ABC-type Fe3+-hydroxamate transport system substrate-binding protein